MHPSDPFVSGNEVRTSIEPIIPYYFEKTSTFFKKGNPGRKSIRGLVGEAGLEPARPQ